MKKIIITLLILLNNFIFSQEIIIHEIIGKVQVSIENKFIPLQLEMLLTETNLINIGLNSSLVLIIDGKVYSLKSMSKGTIKELIKKANNVIKIGVQATESNITKDASGRTNISTASTRASEGIKEVEWEE